MGDGVSQSGAPPPQPRGSARPRTHEMMGGTAPGKSDAANRMVPSPPRQTQKSTREASAGASAGSQVCAAPRAPPVAACTAGSTSTASPSAARNVAMFTSALSAASSHGFFSSSAVRGRASQVSCTSVRAFCSFRISHPGPVGSSTSHASSLHMSSRNGALAPAAAQAGGAWLTRGEPTPAARPSSPVSSGLPSSPRSWRRVELGTRRMWGDEGARCAGGAQKGEESRQQSRAEAAKRARGGGGEREAWVRRANGAPRAARRAQSILLRRRWLSGSGGGEGAGEAEASAAAAVASAVASAVAAAAAAAPAASARSSCASSWVTRRCSAASRDQDSASAWCSARCRADSADSTALPSPSCRAGRAQADRLRLGGGDGGGGREGRGGRATAAPGRGALRRAAARATRQACLGAGGERRQLGCAARLLHRGVGSGLQAAGWGRSPPRQQVSASSRRPGGVLLLDQGARQIRASGGGRTSQEGGRRDCRHQGVGPCHFNNGR